MAILETSALSRAFGDQWAVDDLALYVPEGQVYGFLGGNGAGKSTTIRMLLNLLRPTAGSIRMFGETLTAKNARHLVARTGSLVEMPALYENLSGRENLKINQRILGCAPSRIDAVLAFTGLKDAADKRAGHYSLGMKQRLGLALALLHEPKLLILDEPTNGLDPAGIREMRELLKQLPRDTGVTVFVSSHMLDEVERIADCVGVLHKGKLRYQGPLAHLHANSTLEIGTENDTAARAVLQQSGLSFSAPDSDGLWQVRNANRAQIIALNTRLAEAGAGVFHLQQRRAALEELFFELTHNNAPEARA